MNEDAGRPDEGRPSPRALLELAEKETRGRLKVFLGMAPGVGKTYAMLAAPGTAKAEGVDVVVGVAETHGRAETAALLDGMEVLPRRPVAYRRRTLMEFDVEAAIARRPKLLIVDELAHTNAPDLLHPKRYQDVEEVLRAGIDVWTTLNIQHLESLTDVIERITGITVRETIPDKVLEDADEIVVVDLPPEDLIQRLRDGKVYLPADAQRAVDRFFRPSNLTALRELALRRAVDRVDEQMLSQLRQRGIEGPWPTAERLLVCVGTDDQSEKVVRVAARMASALKSDWIALHLMPSDRDVMDRKVLRKADKMMRLAARLGATTARLNARDLTADILSFARRNNITQIVLGRSDAGPLNRLFGRSLSDEVVAHAKDMAVTVVAPPASEARGLHLVWHSPSLALSQYLAVSAVVLGAVIMGMGIELITVMPSMSMIFLLAVLLCGLRFGTWAAIAAAALSFVAYNYFFIDPRYTFAIRYPYSLLSLTVFLVVAVLTGGLAGRLREQASATRARAENSQALYDFSSKLAGAAKLDDVVWLLARHAAGSVRGGSIVLLGTANDLAIQSGWPPEDTLSTADWTAARWAFEKREPAGRMTGTLPSAKFHFRPLISSKGSLGVIGVYPNESEDAFPSGEEAALQSIIDQAAIAIERTQLVEEATHVQAAAESEKLRAALLSSISHDLRTPLSSVVGAVTSLRTLGDRMNAKDRDELLATIDEEAGRLSRFVANLLDMTKLEAGALDIRRDWVDTGDVVRGAVARAQRSFPNRRMSVAIAPDLPPVRGDATLLEQVVFNLLDNADKYSAADSVTDVSVTAAADVVMVAVTDQGVGIPADALDKIFDKFYRVGHGDSRAPGTGLGLSICAGLIAAMGGTIRAVSPVDGRAGTRMTISLPVELPASGK